MQFTLLSVMALATFAVAAPAANPDEANSVNQVAKCGASGNGVLSCCDKVTTADDAGSGLGGLLGSLLGPIDVGLTCNPITAIGPGFGTKCQKSTVCCNTQGGPQTNNGLNILSGAQIPICPSIPIQAA